MTIPTPIRAAILAAALCSFAAPALAQLHIPNWPPRQRYEPPPEPYYPPQRNYPPPQYYPPPEAYYPPAYPSSPRVDRRRVADYCETSVGICQTPGPMYVGRSCNCFFPGYGRVPGHAIQGGY